MRPRLHRPCTFPWPLLATLAASLALLTACSEPALPALTVTPTTLTVGTSVDRELSVRNDGEPSSTLRFSIVSDDPWLRLEPSSGSVQAGEAVVVSVGVRAGMAPPPGTIAAVEVRSNVGSKGVRVGMLRSSGVTLCTPGHHDPIVTHGAGTGIGSRPAPATFDVPPAPSRRGTPASSRDEVLVAYHSGASSGPVSRATLSGSVASNAGASLVRAGAQGQHDLMALPPGEEQRALAAIASDPRVALVAPNVSVHRLASTPDDPAYADQWWAWCFGLPEAWSISTGDLVAAADDIVVAVVDDGFNVVHVDLAAKALPGWDIAEGNADVRTSSSHGTHVAGIALAAGDNAVGVAGVAYGASVRLLPVKVFPDDTTRNGNLDDLINGMRWAVGLQVAGAPGNVNPADIVNLSLGIGATPPTSTIRLLEATLSAMREQGAVVVAAAGNRGSGLGVEYPARAADAIAVGSVDWTGLRSSFSTHGDGLDLMAPGGAAHPSVSERCKYVVSLGARSDTSLFCQPGTSMAAPFVSGTAALLMATDPDTYRGDAAAARARLLDTALRGAGMGVVEYGAGIVCPDAALGAATRCGWPPAD